MEYLLRALKVPEVEEELPQTKNYALKLDLGNP